MKVSLPCHVTLTRVSPRKLDFDNLVYSFKTVKDVVADLIISNAYDLPLLDSKGRYDGDDRITWSYDQISESAKVGFYLKVEML